MEHTNRAMSFGPLNWLPVTPDHHRIHYSATLHRGRNPGGTFRLLFGTYVVAAEMPEEYPLGLGERVEGKKSHEC